MGYRIRFFLILLWLPLSSLQGKELNDKGKKDLQESLAIFSTSFRDFGYELRNMSQTMITLVRELRDQLGVLSFAVNTFGQELKFDILSLKSMGGAIRDQLKEDGDMFKGIRTDIGHHLHLTDGLHKSTSANTHLDCSDWYRSGKIVSGVYRVRPQMVEDILGSFDVYCDMDTDGGGWTVIQKRGDFGLPEEYFFKSWQEYQVGFGYFNREFWLGNDRISALSNQKSYNLRVDLKHMDNSSTFAKYAFFRVDNRYEMYTIHVGNYSGNAGDSLSQHSGVKFSTKDRDTDKISRRCPMSCRSAWWFNTCSCFNLNGPNLKGHQARPGGAMEWHKWKGPLHSVIASEIKIRPDDF